MISVAARPRRRGSVPTFSWRKLGWGVLGLLLFVVALEVLKAGAAGLGPLVSRFLRPDDAAAALGFGWLLSYVVMSGSPVAATAVALYAEAVLDAYGAFAMITGSRFGAAFVVLIIGFVYHLRRRDAHLPEGFGGFEQRTSLEMGVLSLLVTFAIYVPALAVGYVVLRAGVLDGVRLDAPRLVDAIGVVSGPVVAALDRVLAAPLLALLGLALVVVALKTFDNALPDLSGVRARTARQRVFRPTVMFALGLVVTFFTLSVSVSLGLLVPLAARGYARRENVIPYIMGANVSTFVDTLLAAVLVGEGVRPLSPAVIVLAEMISVALVSALVILFAYRHFERGLLVATRAVLRSRATLAAFILAILGVPILLLVL